MLNRVSIETPIISTESGIIFTFNAENAEHYYSNEKTVHVFLNFIIKLQGETNIRDGPQMNKQKKQLNSKRNKTENTFYSSNMLHSSKYQQVQKVPPHEDKKHQPIGISVILFHHHHRRPFNLVFRFPNSPVRGK